MSGGIVIDAISAVMLVIGSIIVVVGSIGLIRLPDVFSRMHAAGMADTLGAGFLLGAMMLQAGFSLVTFKLGVLLALLWFTTPVATHALSRAALYAGVVPKLARKEELERVAGSYPINRDSADQN